MRIFIIAHLLFLNFVLASGINRLSYHGRLLQTNGAPITGPIELIFKLYKNADVTVQCTQTISNVPLIQGIFNVELAFPALCAGAITFKQFLLNSANNGDMVYLEVTDNTNGKTYDKQALNATVYSLIAGQLAGTLDASQISSGNISNTEFNYLDGVTSNIQNQLDSKTTNTSIDGDCSAADQYVKDITFNGNQIKLECASFDKLRNGTHTISDCLSISGAIYRYSGNLYCLREATSCPSGWTLAYRKFLPKTCTGSYAPPTGGCSSSLTWTCGTTCTTSNASFTTASSISCTYKKSACIYFPDGCDGQPTYNCTQTTAQSVLCY